MKPGQVAAFLFLLAWIFLAMAFLTSCVSVPVPPFGEKVGQAGTLKIRLAVNYEPHLPESSSPSIDYAWSEFLKAAPKTLRDK
jgi:hypothetical protein